MIVGKRIRALRKERGLTQKELGDELNLDKTTISHYENGRRMPDLEFIKKVTNYFKVDINTFFGTEYIVKSKQKKEIMSKEEIDFILELRKTDNYNIIMNEPEKYARILGNKDSKKEKFPVGSK